MLLTQLILWNNKLIVKWIKRKYIELMIKIKIIKMKIGIYSSFTGAVKFTLPPAFSISSIA